MNEKEEQEQEGTEIMCRLEEFIKSVPEQLAPSRSHCGEDILPYWTP